MNDVEKKKAAKQFIKNWENRGDEKQETQSFWLELLQTVYGVDAPTQSIKFELPVEVSGSTKYIDGFIKDTLVLIEQKSRDVSLKKGAKQSDGQILSPFEQARRYGANLPLNQNPRWIITCNFGEFQVHDMDRPNDPPEIICLKDLEKDYPRLNFLVRTQDERIKKELEVCFKAGDLVGAIYDALLKQYKDPESPEALKSLNALCVRIVFCLYAEDAGIFGESRTMFHDYLKAHEKTARSALMDLFRVLDQRPEDRDKYLDDDLLAFPYVNGGLFKDEDIIIPKIDSGILDLILNKASDDFDWSAISPTIFGAVFESTLNPETRRKGGMHYTIIENIHKVIDPLFLDELKGELAGIKALAVEKTRRARLEAFQNKLASLTFLDPACGSGNFLTETYLSLRRMENEVISLLNRNQIAIDMDDPIKVSIGQFYGIEINDFAVTVAKTALWIAESQMLKETADVVNKNLDFLPLKNNANIVKDNALTKDWEEVIPRSRLNYIMGNPPFVGARLMSEEQKEDINRIFAGWKNAGNLDYVACWYKKAADMMAGTAIRSALVSTNSITQGEAVANLWKPLFEGGVHIDFAHRTFRWDSEAAIKAHVHCVIVGFSIAPNSSPKVIYTSDKAQVVEHINAYLVEAEDVFVESRSKPLCDVPTIGIGNKPIDGGHYLFEKEEMEAFLKIEPAAKAYFHPWYGAFEFINRKPRYCLYLGNCPPNELRKMPECMKRVTAVREYRLSSNSPGTVKLADSPTRFHVSNFPKGTYVVIPEVSSERRKYIPMGFMTPDILCSNLVKIVPNATIYHFGVLISNVHMAWMRAVCGRLEMRYRYSKDVVYNNFPWPEPTDEQRAKIEQTAQAILDARALYPDASLADLYDEVAMPPELRKAHRENDKAVMAAYGFDYRTMTEPDCVAQLMKLYQKLTEG
ncbi:MAG: class I SAM-dependent DNA methyltransferase [Oscillospiraceae bacterium]|nr:class I SAM-dependent DNA methyltransferase [Oscillospiraceae bacterium]